MASLAFRLENGAKLAHNYRLALAGLDGLVNVGAAVAVSAEYSPDQLFERRTFRFSSKRNYDRCKSASPEVRSACSFFRFF
jgi:hypothetical protein